MATSEVGNELTARFRAVRAQTAALAAPLSAEDAMLQSMPDASPSKWHLAHSTWFFEQFVLARNTDYVQLNPDFAHLFNSYYESVGPRHARPHRGLLSRPTLVEIMAYREAVNARMVQVIERGDVETGVVDRIVLGLEHEQQHQELLLTDIKHAFWMNPLRPAYRNDLLWAPIIGSDHCWHAGMIGAVESGVDAWPEAAAFAFDHESPRHRVWLAPHALAARLVTSGEYREFVRAGGYRTPALWLSAGWEWIREHAIERPLYWDEDCEREFTLGGMRAIDPHAPVVHVSYFEADAFARWSDARLPTESEWEDAAKALPVRGNFLEADTLHPTAAGSANA
ncbi:MAG: ergothioneine biosynthesis protein EgtB, partial [Lysobacterales bacterium]